MSSGASKGLAAGSSTITATYGAQTATLALTVVDGTLITPSPTTLTLTAGGTATPFTVTCRKPDGTTDGSPTYTATSSNTSIATVAKSGTTVTVTPVAAGSCTIDLSYSNGAGTATYSVPIAVTAGAGTVTSVTPVFNGADVSSGALLFTGTAYTFGAKDQSGNALDGTVGSWSTTDGTNAPINASTGVCSPNANVCGATLTYTHTASGHTATIPVSVLKPPATVVTSDAGSNYTNTAALMGNLAAGGYISVDSSYNSNVPTGSYGSSKYTDGFYGNHLEIDGATAARQFMGSRVFTNTITPAHDGGCLRTKFATSYTRAWGITVNRFDPGFDMLGTGSGGASYKITPWFGLWSTGANGYVGPSGSNGNHTGGTGGAPGGNYNTTAQVVLSGTQIGGGHPTTIGNVTSEFGAGEWWVDVLLFETVAGSMISQRWYHFRIGEAPRVMDNGGTVPHGWVEGPMNAGVAMPGGVQNFSPFGENYNLTATTTYVRSIALWQVVDGVTYGDPFGILNDTTTPTLTSIGTASAAHGSTGTTVTFTGTNFTENCWPVFSNPGVQVQSRAIVSGTSMSCVINVDSSASLGAGTVAIYKSSTQATTATQVFTVT